MFSKLISKSYKSDFLKKIEIQGLSKVCKFINALKIFINDPLRHPRKTDVKRKCGKKGSEHFLVYFKIDKDQNVINPQVSKQTKYI